MDDVNQPQGNGPQDHSPTEPSRPTPSGWPDESPAYGQPEHGRGQQFEGGPWLAGPDYPQPDPYQQSNPYRQQQPSATPGPYPAGSWQSGPDPYGQQPGGPGPYAQQPGGPDPYAQQPGGPGPFSQQPGSPGLYAQQPGGPGPYAQNRPTQQLPSPDFPPRKQTRPGKSWMQNRKVRWGAGIAAAVVFGAGGTLAGLELTGGSSAPPANAAQAVALNSAIGYTTGCSISSVSNNSGSAAIKADEANLRRCLHSHLRLVTGMYGEIAYHTTSGTETLAFERGVVQSTTGGQLTIQAQNGTTWTWDVGGSPIIRKSGKAATVAILQTGMKVFVGGLDDGSSKDAKLILIQAGKSGSGKNAGSHHKKSSKSAGTSTST
jgi:hypothetical protein